MIGGLVAVGKQEVKNGREETGDDGWQQMWGGSLADDQREEKGQA